MDKNRIVKTFTGKKEKRSSCKRIRGEYYLVGNPSIKNSGECYLIESQYHRFNNGLIEYDYSVGNYVLIHKNHLKNGVVDIDENNNPVMGYYSPNLVTNVSLRESDNLSKSKDISCLNEELAAKLGYKERLADGIFYSLDLKKSAKFFNEISNKLINKNNLPYDSLYSFGIVKEVYDQTFKPEYNNKELNKLGDWLEDNGITFGVEFETSNGYIAQRLCYKYGVLALRDGSIDGLEYVTVPLSGKKGLYALRGICEKLKERTKYNIKCALHIHIGGLKREEVNLVAAHNLGGILQSSLYDLQPHYKKGGTGHHNNERGKDYSKKISNSHISHVNKDNSLLDKFTNLFEIISDGKSYSRYENSLKKVKSHPSDPAGTSKWNIGSRYTWLNLVPIVFGNKKTLEFRQHSPTFEFEKVINFLISCATFVKFTNLNAERLVDLKSDLCKELKDSDNPLLYVASKSLPTLKFSNILSRFKKYNTLRKGIMTKLTKDEDYLGKYEHKHDKDYGDLLTDKFWD